ncbi:MAG: PEP/pyruvate-binding domain-containing protein, partial [Candidatus Thorarchaeota archaeon]|nr:PEP/pyruvate-binding domain-containing protein [Candidatus Thorarchaeota archaeon]
MSTAHYVLSLDAISEDSIPLVGGKAAKLGEMKNEGFQIPDAFVVTTKAYVDSISKGGVKEIISQALAEIDYDQPETVKAASERIMSAIEDLKLDDSILGEINSIYHKMGETRVAVRSSATAEDLAEASFAGQYETYLNVKGSSSLLENIKKCYTSLWVPRAISYRHSKGIQHEAVQLAVLVQTMVDAKKAGVLFTDDPTAKSGTQMVIESNFGLGESVVSGVASPDRYTVSRKDNRDYKTHKVLSCEIGTKDIIIQSDTSSSGISSTAVSPELGQQSSLSNEEAIALAEIGADLEKLFEGPQDIEWAFDDKGVIHVLQSRPITVLKGKSEDDEIMWSRGYSDDYWNDNVTPLFFELLGQ